MILYTRRLILRPWTIDDAKWLYEFARDPEVGPAAGWAVHKNVDESKDIIENVLMVENNFSITELSAPEIPIGTAHLMTMADAEVDFEAGDFEIGYWLAKPYWGRGYMPEAVTELIRYAFEELNAPTLWIRYFPENEKSARVTEKLGFEYIFRQFDKPQTFLGGVKDLEVVRLTREQWQKIRHRSL